MKSLILILITLSIGCASIPPSPHNFPASDFPEYYYGMTLREFLDTYPKEMVQIGVGMHGGKSIYYIPNKGVAGVYFDKQSHKIYAIHMRPLRPEEVVVARELLKRKRAIKKAVEEGKMPID